MSIAALPTTTVRQIGSAQVIVSPTSCVKELIDNALDARASSIAVEFSANTIDVIQVRDNGFGVAPEDRPLVAKRYCTSKLREYADLKGIGGKSLGFRGEALAALAECTGCLTITTRVEGEPTAVALKIGKDGETVG